MASGAADSVIEVACAKAAHEVARAYSEVFGQQLPHWEEMAAEQRDAVLKVVDRVLSGADAPAIHMLRCQRLEMMGVESPLRVPFEKLPEAQAVKDLQMVATINAMALALGHTSARAVTVRAGG